MMRTFLSLLWLAASPAPAAAPPAGPAAPAPTRQTAPTRAAAPVPPPQAAPAQPAKPAPAPSAAPAQQPTAPVAPVDADQRMDRGLELLHAEKLKEGAAALYDLYAALPETDLRRDAAAFRLAGALVDLGFVQAGIEYYLEVLAGRRSPELLGKALAALKPLYERGLVEEWRFLDGVIYSAQYGDLEPEVADFIEYMQALGDLRLGFSAWGRGRLETLATTDRMYGWRARYLLAVERMQQRNDEGAEKLLRQILDASAAPAEVRTVAALALARAFGCSVESLFQLADSANAEGRAVA